MGIRYVCFAEALICPIHRSRAKSRPMLCQSDCWRRLGRRYVSDASRRADGVSHEIIASVVSNHFSKGGTGEQTKPNLRPDDRFYLPFCAHHFSVDGSKCLMRDGQRCSVYFFPKILGVVSFGIQIFLSQRISLLPSLAMCQSGFFCIVYLVILNNHLYALFDVYVLGLPR